MKSKIKIKKELRNKMLIVGVSLAILAGIYGTSLASVNHSRGSRSEMIEMLAKKFNLDEDEVKDFIKEHQIDLKKDRNELMKKRFQERLNREVEKGSLTENQKGLILEKRAEMERKINQDLEKWEDLREKRRERIENYRQEMRVWAKENRIDLDLLGLGRIK
jgi:hypothetical protein